MLKSMIKHCISSKIINFGNKGSVIVEGTIFLPVFIIAVMSVSFIINIVSIQMQVNHNIADESLSLLTRAYKERIAPEYPLIIKSKLYNNLNDKIKNLHISNYHYLNDNGKISANISYDIKNPMPIDLIGPMHIKTDILFRGFIGELRNTEPMSYEELENNYDDNEVYIFPKYGEKYHSKNCRCISIFPKEKLLTNHIRRHCSACKACKPDDLANGSKVFVSEKSRIYHQGKCSTVNKMYIKINKNKAVEQGYKSCKICGGT